jgi:hypothetical protein
MTFRPCKRIRERSRRASDRFQSFSTNFRRHRVPELRCKHESPEVSTLKTTQKDHHENVYKENERERERERVMVLNCRLFEGEARSFIKEANKSGDFGGT